MRTSPMKFTDHCSFHLGYGNVIHQFTISSVHNIHPIFIGRENTWALV